MRKYPTRDDLLAKITMLKDELLTARKNSDANFQMLMKVLDRFSDLNKRVDGLEKLAHDHSGIPNP